MRKKLSLYLVLLLSAFMLLVVAIYNQYPLINSDTGSYVKYAFDFQVPQDRSPFYGVFVGFSSLWVSLWNTIIIQAAVVVFLLYRYIGMFWENKPVYPLYVLLLLVGIVLCTHLGWVVSFIMPDIFTAILILATVLYLYDKRKTVWFRYVYVAMIFIAIAVHNSHYLSYLLFSIFMVVLGLIGPKKEHLKKAAVLLCITAINWLILCTLNYSKGFGFTLSSGRHVFMAAKFVETGIMKRYLDDSCVSKALRLCAYKEHLPNTLSEYLWADYSPLYSTGGWEHSKTENDMIARDVFTTPEYLAIYMKQSFVNSVRQLTALELPDTVYSLGEGSSALHYISRHLPHEVGAYKKSRQYSSGLETGKWDVFYVITFLLSTLWILSIVGKLADKKLVLGTYVCIVLFIVLNAVVTATFSEVVGRLHYRVFWVLPATNIILFVRYYSKHFTKGELSWWYTVKKPGASGRRIGQD